MNSDQFLLEDYRQKIQYLSNHLARMWTRLNFFLVVNSALFGFSMHESYQGHSKLLICSGLLLSVAWYYFGAVDNYLAEIYRKHVERSFELVKESLDESLRKREDELCYVGDVGKPMGARRGPLQWRIPWLSATEMSVVYGSIFVFLWILRFWLAPPS